MSFLETISKRIDGIGAHPEKKLINALTVTAQDVMAGNVPGTEPANLMSLILKKILKAKPNKKVPLWYLIDSILFNVGHVYLKNIENDLPAVFQDTHRSVSPDDKKRLQKLLYRWDGRANFLSKDVLHETRARMHPGFKLNEYKVYRKKKQQKEDQQTQYQQQQQQLLQFQMNQPIEHIIDESAYWIEVEKTVKRLLKLLQKGEPEDRQVTVDVIKTLQPQIYNTLRQNAQEELRKRGIKCRNPNYISYSNTGESTIRPTELNWDIKFLSSGNGLTDILDKVLNTGVTSSNPVIDQLTNLNFETLEKKNLYHSLYVVSSASSLQEIRQNELFYEESKICRESHRSRAYFIDLDRWVQNGEEFVQDYSVERFAKVEDEFALEDKDIPKVLVDEEHTVCGITGEKFKRVFDEQLNEWVYINAVRPVEGGPIYLNEAYEQSILNYSDKSEAVVSDSQATSKDTVTESSQDVPGQENESSSSNEEPQSKRIKTEP